MFPYHVKQWHWIEYIHLRMIIDDALEPTSTVADGRIIPELEEMFASLSEDDPQSSQFDLQNQAHRDYYSGHRTVEDQDLRRALDRYGMGPNIEETFWVLEAQDAARLRLLQNDVQILVEENPEILGPDWADVHPTVVGLPPPQPPPPNNKPVWGRHPCRPAPPGTVDEHERWPNGMCRRGLELETVVSNVTKATMSPLEAKRAEFVGSGPGAATHKWEPVLIDA
jgi:hypothetical protein